MWPVDKYFPDLTDIQTEQFEMLAPLYEDWNNKVNVISRKDIGNLYVNHVLHSLAIARFPGLKNGMKILDVGTGGGFPGIPLAIMFPEIDFLLIDSIGKKIKVVEAICKELGLRNCTAVQTRAENVKDKFDFVVSRAVTALPKFVGWVRNNIKKRSDETETGGILYLKGGDLADEIQIPYKVSIYSISEYFDEAFFESKKLVYVQIP